MATTPSSGSMTSPVPLITSEVSLSATASRASSFPKRRSVRQSLANSTAARRSWPCFSSLDSNSSNRVKASAAAPAKPARTWPSLPNLRTLRALPFITVCPSVTWPSPATATLPSRRTDRIVVAWNTFGFWLGVMRPPGVSDGGGDVRRGFKRGPESGLSASHRSSRTRGDPRHGGSQTAMRAAYRRPPAPAGGDGRSGRARGAGKAAAPRVVQVDEGDLRIFEHPGQGAGNLLPVDDLGLAHHVLGIVGAQRHQPPGDVVGHDPHGGHHAAGTLADEDRARCAVWRRTGQVFVGQQQQRLTAARVL